jgi:hypothetical protein
MRYIKGDFITIPNKNALMGLGVYEQAVFLWLCSYADEEGTCYPSLKAIASNCGCSKDAVRDALAMLCESGLLKVEPQFDGDRQTTNLYKIMLVSGVAAGGGLPTARVGGSSQQGTGVADTDTNYIHKNSIHKKEGSVASQPPLSHGGSLSTEIAPDMQYEEVDEDGNAIKRLKRGRAFRVQPAWSFDDTMQQLRRSKTRIDQVVWLYLTHKERIYRSQTEWEQERTGLMKAAKPLVDADFTPADLREAFIYMDKVAWKDQSWSLFNVFKYAKDARDENLNWPVNKEI